MCVQIGHDTPIHKISMKPQEEYLLHRVYLVMMMDSEASAWKLELKKIVWEWGSTLAIVDRIMGFTVMNE